MAQQVAMMTMATTGLATSTKRQSPFIGENKKSFRDVLRRQNGGVKQPISGGGHRKKTLTKPVDQPDSVNQSQAEVKQTDGYKEKPEVEVKESVTKEKTKSTNQEETTEGELIEGVVDELGRKVHQSVLVFDLMADKLSLTDDQLMALLEDMGLQTIDLMDTKKINQLFLKAKDLQTGDLLTNQESAEAFKQLLMELSSLERREEVSKIGQGNDSGVVDKGQENQIALVGELAKTEEGILLKEQGLSGQETEMLKSDKQVAKELNQEDRRLSASGKISAMETAFSQVVKVEKQEVVMNNFVGKIYKNVTVNDVFDQIVNKFNVELSTDKSSITMQLEPASLGKLAFQVVSRGGVLTGEFVAETETAKNLIESQLSQLKSVLVEQGIKVNEVKVTLGDALNYFAEQQQKEKEQTFQQKTKRHSRRIGRQSEEEEPLWTERTEISRTVADRMVSDSQIVLEA